jgi:hypothetical protein
MALIEHIIGDCVIQRTSPWAEPAPATISTVSKVPTLVKLDPLSGHQHDASKQITGNFKKLAVASKEKKKTRRQGAAGGVEVEATNADNSPGGSEGFTIAVDKRALRALNILFHSPDSPNQPGDLAWPDFLHAMVKTGFGAEKLQGSACHFSPTKLDVERSIQFHEPPPGNKLPFTWARRYGRRLTRAFGWTNESFELA